MDILNEFMPTDVGIKLCRTCNKFKRIEEFYQDRRTKDGRYGSCKECHYNVIDHWKRRNKDSVIKSRRKSNSKPYRRWSRIERIYNMTESSFNDILYTQNNECRICKINFCSLSSKHIHIDHCHTSGKIRGILCRKCNNALGCVGDSVYTLERMIEYLKESKNDGKVE